MIVQWKEVTKDSDTDEMHPLRNTCHLSEVHESELKCVTGGCHPVIMSDPWFHTIYS